MILVMSYSGMFNPPGNSSVEAGATSGKPPIELWDLTWDKVNKFLPDLKNDLFPQVKSSELSQDRSQEKTEISQASVEIQPTSLDNVDNVVVINGEFTNSINEITNGVTIDGKM